MIRKRVTDLERSLKAFVNLKIKFYEVPQEFDLISSFQHKRDV